MPKGAWWRGIAVAAGYTVLVAITSLASGSASAPGFAGRVGLVAVGGALAGFGLGPFAARLHMSAVRRIGVLFGIAFALLSVSNAIEVALYLPGPALAGMIAGGLVESLALAVLLGLLWPPDRTAERTARPVRAPLSTVWRLAVLAVLWVPVFLAFAALDGPVVRAVEHARGTGTFTSPPLIRLANGVEITLSAITFALLAAVLLGPSPRGRTALTWNTA